MPGHKLGGRIMLLIYLGCANGPRTLFRLFFVLDLNLKLNEAMISTSREMSIRVDDFMKGEYLDSITFVARDPDASTLSVLQPVIIRSP